MKTISARKLAANRANLAKAGPLTDAGRERIRQAVLRSTPWQQSTGPRTPEGKAKCRLNALKHGRETAAARAWRKEAVRFIAQSQQLREVLLGQKTVADERRLVSEVVQLAGRLG